MKYLVFISILLLPYCGIAQNFISKGMIEYEVKSNTHKAMGNGAWADMMKDKIPKLSTSYYRLTFNGERSIYLYNRIDEKSKSPWSDEEGGPDNIWFNDYEKDQSVMQKSVFGEIYLLNDSLSKIKWKLSNETREIAGFTCRKATGIIFDSVYVFAFYTDEITTSGGPMSLHGLPGMILGLTIPRMFTSWVATKIDLTITDEAKIKAPVNGKKQEALQLQKIVTDATKEWGTYGQQAIWNIFL